MTNLLGFIPAWTPFVIVCLLDMQNLLSWSKRLVLARANRSCKDYTIIIPLYNHPKYFEDRNRIKRYKNHIVVACDIGTEAMKEGADMLEKEGWRVFRCEFKYPTAPMLMKAVLDAGVVDTTYTIRLDADTYITRGIGQAVEAIRRDGADIASVKCHILSPQTLCERMQEQEYKMAMQSRHYRPWLLSGACYIAKTKSLQQILDKHTLWFLSEDSETGRVAYQLKMRIRHVDYEVLTAGPPTWRGLWKQRSNIWWAGNFRHVWINFDHNILHMPVWVLYYAALVWVGLSWKWSSLIQLLRYWPVGLTVVLFLFCLYTFITFAANWRVRSRYMWFIPYYSLVQSLLTPPVGFINFMKYAITRRQAGRYRFGYFRKAVP